MANIKLSDGSELELSAEEMVLYLKATGQFVEPKSQAEVIAEKMAEIRKEERGSVATLLETQTAVQETIAEAEEVARAEAAAQEVVRKHTPADVPRHGALTRNGSARVRLTVDEARVFHALKAYPNGLRASSLMPILGWGKNKVTGHLSAMYNQSRGLAKGPSSTWLVAPWAKHAVVEICHYPNRAPKQGDITQ